MANLLRTTRTYASFANAEQALSRALAAEELKLEDVRYIIAASADGRFAPVLVGQQYIRFAVFSPHITVVG